MTELTISLALLWLIYS